MLGVLGLAVACAQNPPDLAALEHTAQKYHAEWESVAKDLDERMARILPCDPRYAAAITEVSRASEARLAALADYIRGVSGQALAETAAAKILLNAEEKRAVEASLERADAGQEQSAVDTQFDALAQSIKQRPSLEDAQKLLEHIAAMIRQRAEAAERETGAADAAVGLLRGLVKEFDTRDAALRDESAALESERARWNGYYAARLARARTECSITQAGIEAGPLQSKNKARAKGKR